MTRERPGPPAGLLLAAGGGSRFGGPKALAIFDGELLVERGIRLLEDGGCKPVLVVLGAAADKVRRRADLSGAHIITNPVWPSGIGSSLRCGLATLVERSCPAVVVALVDQPLVTAEAVNRLIAAWRTGALAAVAFYGGRPRNPVLLDASLWDDVAATAVGDVGARAWLRARPELVTPVACDDVASPADIDTPDDLVALLERDASPKPQGRL